MANNALSAIRSALLTQLGQVTSLQQVQSGRMFEHSGYPYCRVYLSAVPNNELKDNMPSYWRNYQFTIEIVQDASAKAASTAEENLQDCIDDVLDRLGSQWTLSGNVDTTVTEGGTIAPVETSHGPGLVATIQFSARTLIS